MKKINKYRYFEKYNTSIIKSGTGTWKTTAINSHMKTYLKQHPTTQFLSIAARQSLSIQHMINFKDIGIMNYQDRDTDPYESDALTICINSMQIELK